MSTDSGPQPLVSIVVPTFNQGRFIEDCLQSIAKQSFQKFEVLIFDSLSTDETESICQKFCARDLRFRYFREKDRGQSDALNKGLQHSVGRIWTWLCSDDRYSSAAALEHLVASLPANAEAQGVVGAFGRAQYMDEDGHIERPYRCLTKSVHRQDFLNDWPFSQPASILIKKEVVRCGGIDANLQLGMDLDLFLRLLDQEAKSFVYVDIMVADVRNQGESKSVRLRKQTAINSLQILKKYFPTLGDFKSSAYIAELREVTNDTEFCRFMVKLGAHKLGMLVHFARIKLRTTLAGKAWGKVKGIFIN